MRSMLPFLLAFLISSAISNASTADDMIWRGESPSAMVSAGEEIYASFQAAGGSEILRLSKEGEVLDRFYVDGLVRGLAYSDGSLFVSHSDSISIIRDGHVREIASGLNNPSSMVVIGDMILVSVTGGIARIRTGEDMQAGAGDILFLEIWTNQHGIARTGPQPRIMIDFPTYSLEDGVLTSHLPVEGVETADLIVGSGTSLSGDLGGGASSMLEAVNIPYTAEIYTRENVTDAFQILRIDNDRVYLEHLGEEFVLGPGEARRFTRNTTSPDGSLDIVSTTIVTNHGLVYLKQPQSQDVI